MLSGGFEENEKLEPIGSKTPKVDVLRWLWLAHCFTLLPLQLVQAIYWTSSKTFCTF